MMLRNFLDFGAGWPMRGAGSGFLILRVRSDLDDAGHPGHQDPAHHVKSEGDSCSAADHEGLPDEQSPGARAFWTASLKSLPAAQPGFMRGEPPAAPKTPPKVEPGFWFWGSVPVRILETPDGGLDAERLDRKTGKWVRDVRMISEVYFNPGGSTPAEKVGEKKFYSRVAGMLKKNC